MSPPSLNNKTNTDCHCFTPLSHPVALYDMVPLSMVRQMPRLFWSGCAFCGRSVERSGCIIVFMCAIILCSKINPKTYRENGLVRPVSSHEKWTFCFLFPNIRIRGGIALAPKLWGYGTEEKSTRRAWPPTKEVPICLYIELLGTLFFLCTTPGFGHISGLGCRFATSTLYVILYYE